MCRVDVGKCQVSYAIDLETTGLRPGRDNLLAASVSTGEQTWSWLIKNTDDLLAAARYLGGDIIVHGAPFECSWAQVLGVKPENVTDTMLLAYRVSPGSAHNLDALVAHHLPVVGGYKAESEALLAKGATWRSMPEDVLLRRNAVDAWATYRLCPILWSRLSPQEQQHHREDVAIALAVARAGAKGLYFSCDAAQEILVAQEKLMADAVSRLPEGMNPGSSQQVAALLSSFGIELPQSEKGNDQTGEIVLRILLTQTNDERVKHIVNAVLDYRGAQKVIGTYIHGYAKRVEGDGYLRSSLRWPGTITWRPSSSDPNLLNVPRGEVRKLFRAPPGYVFFEGDYSQVELRIAAALSGDPILCNAYREGLDVHTITARALFDVEAPDYDQRHRGKTVNFGTLYGAGARTLWEQFLKGGVVVPIEEVASYRKKFWQTYAVLDSFRVEETRKARQGGVLYAPTGAYRWSLDDFILSHPMDAEEAARGVFNATIQSVAPRLVGRAMVEIEQEDVADVRLHTYDGICGYLPEADAVERALRIKAIMEAQGNESWWNGVPCVADVKIGPSWGELKEVK